MCRQNCPPPAGKGSFLKSGGAIVTAVEVGVPVAGLKVGAVVGGEDYHRVFIQALLSQLGH